MAKTKKALLSRRVEIVELIRREPGITSAELATRLGLASSTTVSSAIWPSIKSNQILVERITKDGKAMNAHYHPDQVPPDAVERIKQKLVDASEVIPMAKASDARNSVFDVPGAKRRVKRHTPRKTTGRPSSDAAPAAAKPTPVASRNFACAVTNDGTLVLMRAGEIQFSLSDIEAATLQSYLVKRAAASLFASMA